MAFLLACLGSNQAVSRYSLQAEKFCAQDGFSQWLNVTSSDPNLDVRSCLTASKIAYLNIHFKETQHCYNINHHFQEVMWPITAYIAECIKPIPLFCSLGQIAADHFYRLGEKSTSPLFSRASKVFPTFLFKSFLEDNCLAQDWYTNISLYQPKCFVTITLGNEFGLEEHKLRGAPNKEDRNEIFQSYKRGAMRLLNLTDTRKEHFDLDPSYQRNIIIYTRKHDGDNGRLLIKPEKFADDLRAALPSFTVILIHDLTKLSIVERYKLFDSATVFIAPHGGWAPNMMFMNDHRTFYPRLVLSIEKPWLPVARFSYEVWDKQFTTFFFFFFFFSLYLIPYTLYLIRGVGQAVHDMEDGRHFRHALLALQTEGQDGVRTVRHGLHTGLDGGGPDQWPSGNQRPVGYYRHHQEAVRTGDWGIPIRKDEALS